MRVRHSIWLAIVVAFGSVIIGAGCQIEEGHGTATSNDSTLRATPTPASIAGPPATTVTLPSPTPSPPEKQPETVFAPNAPAENATVPLLIPVMGVKPENLQDTFNEARSEGRVHNAIDIMAPHGTPVVAVADGAVAKLFTSQRGGITVYQSSSDGKLIYYYGHLDRYADGLAEGQSVRRGDILGYVGDTGNATPGNYHLHFSISVVSDPKRWWEGTDINPYPLLRGAATASHAP